MGGGGGAYLGSYGNLPLCLGAQGIIGLVSVIITSFLVVTILAVMNVTKVCVTPQESCRYFLAGWQGSLCRC